MPLSSSENQCGRKRAGCSGTHTSADRWRAPSVRTSCFIGLRTMSVQSHVFVFVSHTTASIWHLKADVYLKDNDSFSAQAVLKAVFKAQRGFSSTFLCKREGGGRVWGGAKSRSQQTLSLLTENIRKQTHTHAELIRKTITTAFKRFQRAAVRMTSDRTFPFHVAPHPDEEINDAFQWDLQTRPIKYISLSSMTTPVALIEQLFINSILIPYSSHHLPAPPRNVKTPVHQIHHSSCIVTFKSSRNRDLQPLCLAGYFWSALFLSSTIWDQTLMFFEHQQMQLLKHEM